MHKRTPGGDDVSTQPLDHAELQKLIDAERALPERRRTSQIESVELGKLRAECRDLPRSGAGEIDNNDDDDGIPITIEL